MSNKKGLRPFTPLKLRLLKPVPSDIEIAQAADIKLITQVAEEVGLLPSGTGVAW